MEDAEKAAADWSKVLQDELGYDPSVKFDGLASWLEANKPDMDKFAERYYKEFLLEHRPG